MPVKIAASILSADFAALGEAVARVEAAGADLLHVDVMDGRFVPNITVGPIVVQALRRRTRLPLDVHLMIVEPERYLADFVRAGADLLTVHAEVPAPAADARADPSWGRAPRALNPSTPPPVLEYADDSTWSSPRRSTPASAARRSAGVAGRVRAVRRLLGHAPWRCCRRRRHGQRRRQPTARPPGRRLRGLRGGGCGGSRPR
jgi:hypothetical protein